MRYSVSERSYLPHILSVAGISVTQKPSPNKAPRSKREPLRGDYLPLREVAGQWGLAVVERDPAGVCGRWRGANEWTQRLANRWTKINKGRQNVTLLDTFVHISLLFVATLQKIHAYCFAGVE